MEWSRSKSRVATGFATAVIARDVDFGSIVCHCFVPDGRAPGTDLSRHTSYVLVFGGATERAHICTHSFCLKNFTVAIITPFVFSARNTKTLASRCVYQYL